MNWPRKKQITKLLKTDAHETAKRRKCERHLTAIFSNCKPIHDDIIELPSESTYIETEIEWLQNLYAKCSDVSSQIESRADEATASARIKSRRNEFTANGKGQNALIPRRNQRLHKVQIWFYQTCFAGDKLSKSALHTSFLPRQRGTRLS